MTPRDAELWRRIFDARLLDVHTALPCRVEAFDAAKQTVDAQPMVKAVIQARDGTQTEESYPLLYKVPVIYPRCGDYFVAFPLKKGDFVTVVFNEWSIGRFRDSGQELHPVDVERHGFSGAVAFPGGPYPNSAPVSETIDALVFGKIGGPLVKVNANGVEMGAAADAKKALAIAEKVEAQLSALKTAISNAVPIAQDGGANLKLTILNALTNWPGSTAATKVKGV